MNYKILRAGGLPQLEYAVNAAVAEGYTPTGAPVYSGGEWIQSVFRAGAVTPPGDVRIRETKAGKR